MKNILKKVILVCILIIIVLGIYFIAVNASKGKKEQKENYNSTTVSKVVQNDNKENIDNSINKIDNTNIVEKNSTKDLKPVTEIKLDDGIKYSITNEEIKPDITLKDNYFDTQIADINTNFDNYEGKTIEIEGLYFENETYTFVGRYALSNLCPNCPPGYSYFEYEWHGEKEITLKDSDSWIKVVGTLKKGNDGVEYYYIDASSIEIMNEKGLETVSN